MGPLQQQLFHLLFDQGFLDDHFTQLQRLQDESNPGFVMEVISLFFRDSQKLLCNMASLLMEDPVDYKRIDFYLHQFTGSSSSIGAHRVRNVCIAFRALCNEQNLAGCIQCLQKLKEEHHMLKIRLKEFLHLEERIVFEEKE